MSNVAPTATEFKSDFPEFGSIADADVQVKLDAAERQLTVDAFDNLYYDAVSYLAADMLVRSPYGQQMQLINDDGRTVYLDYFDMVITPRTARRMMLTNTDIG